jgi:ubiquinone/menaquinone biosynthesis C-methylase UbiE
MITAQELDEWGSVYDPEDLELEQINRMVNLKGKEVLEIGCGVGRVTFKLRDYKKLTAIDMEESFINFCKKKNKDKKIEFIKAEAGSMPFEDSSFDVILATWSVGSSKNIGTIVWDVSRLLKPKGVFLIIEESGLGEFEELKNIFYPGYIKKIRTDNNELKRQLNRFFSKIEQHNVYIHEVYPDLNTAVKWFVFELEKWDKKPVENKNLIKEELKNLVKNGKVVINRGVMFLKAT